MSVFISDEDEEVRCASYECPNLVKDDGDNCAECLAYFAEIKAECARDYINRPMGREDAEEAVNAYSDPSERHKRTVMMEIMENL